MEDESYKRYDLDVVIGRNSKWVGKTLEVISRRCDAVIIGYSRDCRRTDEEYYSPDIMVLEGFRIHMISKSKNIFEKVCDENIIIN